MYLFDILSIGLGPVSEKFSDDIINWDVGDSINHSKNPWMLTFKFKLDLQIVRAKFIHKICFSEQKKK